MFEEKIVIKSITLPSRKELLPTIRRIIYLLKEVTIDTFNKNYEDARFKDNVITKLSNYCIRILNLSNNDLILSRLVELFEQLGDIIKLPTTILSKENFNLLNKLLNISLKSLEVFERNNLIEYFELCSKLTLNHETKDLVKEIGQCLYEKNLKSLN